jgi:nitrogen regulatory protein PII
MRHEGGTEIFLNLLIVICDRGQSGKITDFFRDRNALFNLLTLGRGTASSKILNYLGLGQTEKTVLFSAMPPAEAGDVLERLDEILDLKQPGHGIAFILPLNAAGESVARETNEVKANASNRDTRQDGGSKVAQELFQHALIIAVSNRGYSQEVMDAARTAQAAGGTIVNARVFAPSGAEKFFGVTIQPEKEIVMILAGARQKDDIIRAIAEKTGVGTSADAMAFSLPVSDVRGLQSPLLQREEYRKF